LKRLKKFREGPELETLAKINVAADAKIDLVKRSAAKLIEGSLHAVDDGAVVAGKAVVQNVGGGAQRERAGAFKLREGGQFETPGSCSVPMRTKRWRMSSPEGPRSPGPKALRGSETPLT